MITKARLLCLLVAVLLMLVGNGCRTAPSQNRTIASEAQPNQTADESSAQGRHDQKQ